MKQSILIVFAIILLALVSCSENGTSPVVSNGNELQPVEMTREVLDLVEPYLTLEGGIPDGMMMASPNLNPPDPTDTSFDMYAITFLWGNFPHHPDIGTTPGDGVTNWDGVISINADGYIHPGYTIHFEPDTDSLLPQTSPTNLEFASQTSIGIDGLHFILFVRRNVTSIAAPRLVFETAPISVSWAVHNLNNLFDFYHVDDRNSLLIQSRKIHRNPCKEGFFEGDWVRAQDSNNHGNFFGLWVDHDLGPTGILAGEFWTNDDSSREFRGAVSGLFLPVVIADVSGTWRYDDPSMCPMCGEGGGIIEGIFVMADSSGVGHLSGHFGSPGIPMDVKHLRMRGRWNIHCPDGSGEDIGMR